jgi:hypothetical protein
MNYLTDEAGNPVLYNTAGTALASTARTAVISSKDIINGFGRGLFVHFKVTAGTAGFSATIKIEGKNAAGVYFTLLEGAAVTTTSDNLYIVAPWAAETANASTAKMVPGTFRVTVTPVDTKSITYGVYYDLGI